MNIKVSKGEFSKETQLWAQLYKDSCVNQVIPIMDLDNRLRELEARMMIINQPTPEQLEKYPALVEAYKEYKTIERLILNNDKT